MFRNAILFVFAAVAHAQLPTGFRLALIQFEYKDTPTRYSKLELLTAADEITNYFSAISNGKFHLEISTASIPPPFFALVPTTFDSYMAVDSAPPHNITPTPDAETVIELAALQSKYPGGLDVSGF